jgi:prepilin-type N-terminal cleavage/methylation domain-containing protein
VSIYRHSPIKTGEKLPNSSPIAQARVLQNGLQNNRTEHAMKSHQKGFTLVEIAIVLVIIGLLLGGVLKGQELINQAKIKNIANDLNGMAAAIYGYQDRYKRFPGDDNGAAARWLNPLATSGDGNGQIDGEMNSNAAGTESREFWQHLRLSGFVGGDTATNDQPNNSVGGIVGVQTNTGPVGAPELAGLVVCSSNLPGKIANAIDAQFDDGVSARGVVRGYTQAGSVVANGAANPSRAASAPNYIDDGVTLYTICKGL